MLLLGIDLGTSFIKVSIVDSQTGKRIATAQFPESEAEIISHNKMGRTGSSQLVGKYQKSYSKGKF